MEACLQRARANGAELTFGVSRVHARRWNWALRVDYLQLDEQRGAQTRVKMTLRTADEREGLDALAEQLTEMETARRAGA